jgi:hypothetical protein
MFDLEGSGQETNRPKRQFGLMPLVLSTSRGLNGQMREKKGRLDGLQVFADNAVSSTRPIEVKKDHTST